MSICFKNQKLEEIHFFLKHVLIRLLEGFSPIVEWGLGWHPPIVRSKKEVTMEVEYQTRPV